MRRILAWLSVLALVAVAAAQQKPNLEVLSYSGKVNEHGWIEVAGRVRNNGAALSYVQITYSVYNAKGEQVGTALANIAGLDAGGIWAFKAVCLSCDGGKRFKLKELTGL